MSSMITAKNLISMHLHSTLLPGGVELCGGEGEDVPLLLVEPQLPPRPPRRLQLLRRHLQLRVQRARPLLRSQSGVSTPLC